MKSLTKALSNGSVLKGHVYDSSDASTTILWYGAIWDAKGGTWRGTFQIETYVNNVPTAAPMLFLPHGSLQEEQAIDGARAEGLRRLRGSV